MDAMREGMFNDKNRLVKWIKKAVYVGTLTFHHRTQFENLEQPKRGRCLAQPAKHPP